MRTAAIVALLLAASPPAFAGDLDVGRWLDRPGVRLLAVELYATWCKPCMAAVPKWKALHEKHRKDGLRLVVVATRDPKAGCVNPGWTPDDVVCDDEGRIAEALGAGDVLPAAFLWSWQGNLLVRKGHVEEVANAVEAWVKSAPRVEVDVGAIDPGAGIAAPALRDLVRTAVRDGNKLVVVATAEERARLQRLKAESLKGGFDESTQCEVGKELSPNSLLDVRITGRQGKRRLQLSLLSAEKGCLSSSAVVDWDASDARASVTEAVAELQQRLRPEVDMPRGKPAVAEKREPAAAEKSAAAAPQIPELGGTLKQGGVVNLEVNADALVAYDAAIRAEARGKTSPTEASAAWARLAEIKDANPYKADAARRAEQWKTFAGQKERDTQNLRKILPLETIPVEQKKSLFLAYEGAYGVGEALPMIDLIQVPELKRALCRERLKSGFGRAVSIYGVYEHEAGEVKGAVFVAGVELGRFPGNVTIPTCAAALAGEDDVTKLRAGIDLTPGMTMAKLVFPRFVVRGEVAWSVISKLEWERTPPATEVTADDARSRCQYLNLNGGGWRLPVRSELYDLSAGGRWALPGGKSPNDWVWTGESCYAYDSNGFYAGQTRYDSRGAETECITSDEARYVARCVRGALPQ